MYINKNIRHFREKGNMSQELLAEKMNITRQAVSKWESGESNPSTRNLLELAKIFNVSVNELIGIESDNAKEITKSKPIDWVKILSILSLILAFVPFSVGIIFHKFLPETIPMHYNAAGQINRYGSRNELLVLASCLSLFVIVATIFLVIIKYKKNYKIFLLLSSVFISLVFIVIQVVFTVMAINKSELVQLKNSEMMGIMCIVINLLMLLFGVALPFTKPNPIFGLRITSTMDDPENWSKTHRLAGITIVACSAAGALFAALTSGYISLLSLLFWVVGMIVPVIYSILLQHKNHLNTNKK